MSIRLKQFAASTVAPIDDATLYEHFDNRAGILRGCTVSANGTGIAVTAGRGIICGRVFEITAGTVPCTLGNNVPGRLIVQIDTTQLGDPISYVSQASDPLPALTQENINISGNTLYQMELATYTATTTAVTNVVRTAPDLAPLSDMVTGKARADGWTASRAMISNSAGKLGVSAISTTELSRLSGVTSNIQDQLNAKAAAFTFDSAPTANSGNAVTSGGVYSALMPAQTTLTSSRALTLADAGKYFTCYGSNITVTVPTHADVAFPLGTEILFQRSSATTVTFAAASGVNIRTCGTLSITATYAVACLKKLTSTTWILLGHVE